MVAVVGRRGRHVLVLSTRCRDYGGSRLHVTTHLGYVTVQRIAQLCISSVDAVWTGQHMVLEVLRHIMIESPLSPALKRRLHDTVRNTVAPSFFQHGACIALSHLALSSRLDGSMGYTTLAADCAGARMQRVLLKLMDYENPTRCMMTYRYQIGARQSIFVLHCDESAFRAILQQSAQSRVTRAILVNPQHCMGGHVTCDMHFLALYPSPERNCL